jgi:hypothetical protein
MKQIETRLNEVRKTTANPREMLWQYLATDVVKTWTEDFADPDSGEIIPITRTELMFKKGTKLDNDKITEIQFFMQTGDITEVEVSNQQRQAKLIYLSGLQPWSVSVQTGKAKHRFLLYANSVQMAIDVIKDYIELNYDEPFHITTVKTFTDCIIIPDEEPAPELVEGDDEAEQPERKFYQIDVTVRVTDGGQYTQGFVIHDENVEKSMERIEEWLTNQAIERAEKRGEPQMQFETAIERAIAISCTATVEKEFSLAYVNAEK